MNDDLFNYSYTGLSASTQNELRKLGLIPITEVMYAIIRENLVELATLRSDMLKLNPDYDLEKIREKIQAHLKEG